MCQCAYAGRATQARVQPADLRMSIKHQQQAVAMRVKKPYRVLLLTGIMKTRAAGCISAPATCYLATLACRRRSRSTDLTEAVLRRLQVA